MKYYLEHLEHLRKPYSPIRLHPVRISRVRLTGFQLNRCCIALNENTNRLWVMLQAADARSVEYRNLGTKDQALFDKSRSIKVNNLTWERTGLFRWRSPSSSELSFQSTLYHHDLSTVGKQPMKVELKQRAEL